MAVGQNQNTFVDLPGRSNYMLLELQVSLRKTRRVISRPATRVLKRQTSDGAVSATADVASEVPPLVVKSCRLTEPCSAMQCHRMGFWREIK